MFKEETLQWIKEMQSEGKLAQLNAADLNQLAEEYATKLEAYFYEAVRKQLAPFGKVADFEKMLIYDSQYTTKFLNQSIPGYADFKREIFLQAKKVITARPGKDETP